MNLYRRKNIFVLFISFILISCSSHSSEKEIAEFSGITMGTTYSVKIAYDSNAAAVKMDKTELQKSIDSLLFEINEQMSTYIPDSEISLFNETSSLNWFEISEDFAFVLEESKFLGKLSGGALDITVGPLVELWGFGPKNVGNTIPSKKIIKEKLHYIGLDKLSVRREPASVKKSITDLRIDLSSTAKGFGVDKIADFLISKGFQNFLVEIGGEVKVGGKNKSNNLWRVGITSPKLNSELQQVVSLNNTSMATSGDYWNYFEEDGKRYSHTIDPRTGMPINHKLASVTVIHTSCLTADGFATAIEVLGPDEGFSFALEQKLPVFMIIRSGDEFITKQTEQFSKLLESEKE